MNTTRKRLFLTVADDEGKTMSYTDCSHGSNARLLCRFLAGDASARWTFPRRYYPILQRRAHGLLKNHARDLSVDLAEDIVQRFWQLLLAKPAGSYDPQRGSVDRFMQDILRTALRDVRASYTPPGQPTRLSLAQPKTKYIPVLSLDATVPGEGEQTYGDYLADQQDSLEEAAESVAMIQILNRVRSTANPKIGQALTLIYTQNLSLPEAAKAVGIHRTTLRRNVDSWVEDQRLTV